MDMFIKKTRSLKYVRKKIGPESFTRKRKNIIRNYFDIFDWYIQEMYIIFKNDVFPKI